MIRGAIWKVSRLVTLECKYWILVLLYEYTRFASMLAPKYSRAAIAIGYGKSVSPVMFTMLLFEIRDASSGHVINA